ncbi:hypothetical protein ACYSUO_18660 [Streptomyces sp. UC4497]
MIALRCEKHPTMQVNTSAGPVKFTDGVAEATAEQADAVAEIASAYGITIEADEPEEVDVRPAKSASKADWKAYAVGQGLDEAEAEKATRDELAARYADGGDS